MEFEAIELRIEDGVAYATFNRPTKANALDETLWFEIGKLATWVDESSEIRVLVISGGGKHFSSGIDFSLLQELMRRVATKPDGLRQEMMYQEIRKLQRSIDALERCRKPVIAAIHGSCVGGAIDLICACDIRYAAANARFCVKEIDLGIVADIGTLQRLPRIVGEGIARELAYTARVFTGTEATSFGLINTVLDTPEELQHHAATIAQEIASKSPLTTRGTKQILNYSRDHSVAEGLNYVALWNAGMLMSVDLPEALSAIRENRPATFHS